MTESKGTHAHAAGHGNPHHAHGADSVHHPEQPANSKPFIDPVCGMKVGPNPEREITFGGEVYHFCSPKCMEKFRAAPESYLAAAKPAWIFGRSYRDDVHLSDAPRDSTGRAR